MIEIDADLVMSQFATLMSGFFGLLGLAAIAALVQTAGSSQDGGTLRFSVGVFFDSSYILHSG